jgi:uncharacterized Tic20 family protein
MIPSRVALTILTCLGDSTSARDRLTIKKEGEKMSEERTITQDERVLAGLAHGSILLGVWTNGIGGIAAALVIWMSQKEKSAYVAAQALQALIYQVATGVISLLLWCFWGAVWMALLLPPLIADPEAYETSPPPGLWVGLILMIVPFGIMGLTILYGLWGALRSFNGHDFKYIIIGNWLEDRK